MPLLKEVEILQPGAFCTVEAATCVLCGEDRATIPCRSPRHSGGWVPSQVSTTQASDCHAEASEYGHVSLFPHNAVLSLGLLCVLLREDLTPTAATVGCVTSCRASWGHPDPFDLSRLSSFQHKGVGVGSTAPGSEGWVPTLYQSTHLPRVPWTGEVNFP